MRKFKNLIMTMQGKNKNNLIWLYNSPCGQEKNLNFVYNNLVFYFGGTSARNSEKLLLYIDLPENIIEYNDIIDRIPCETYILHLIYPIINELSDKYVNLNKNIKEKVHFEVQNAGQCFLKRSGINFDENQKKYILKINFCVPLLNAISINAKATVKAITEILKFIELALLNIDKKELERFLDTYKHQEIIRKYLVDNKLCAFVGNGSILPRDNDNCKPLKNAIPFMSPKELEISIRLGKNMTIKGMGIPVGITIITGGGYSGKSTLLDAIEMGIYNHIPEDGREYVITVNNAFKIYAEDGRPVSNLDLTPFFKDLPTNNLVSDFSTSHASGSVSQAANVIEAIQGETQLILIDEDKSATNFLIKDNNMRLLVENDAIIPFTDRISEIYCKLNISTIMVIGGSSEFLAYADNVILMDNYKASVINDKLKKLQLKKYFLPINKVDWNIYKSIIPTITNQPFLYFKNVEIEQDKKIVLDEYSADISYLTTIISKSQLNSLLLFMEKILTNKELYKENLFEYIKKLNFYEHNENKNNINMFENSFKFYEQVRSIDILFCINRMRGVSFTNKFNQ